MKLNIVHPQEEMNPEETAGETEKKSTGRISAGGDGLPQTGDAVLKAASKKTEGVSGRFGRKNRKS